MIYTLLWSRVTNAIDSNYRPLDSDLLDCSLFLVQSSLLNLYYGSMVLKTSELVFRLEAIG